MISVNYFILCCFLLLHWTSASWWFLSRMPLQAVGSGLLCDNVPGLTMMQKQLCREYPDVMVHVRKGVKIGVVECQHQFRFHRWNCSTAASNSDSSVFGKLMKTGSKEVAFIHAISSAGVAHSIAKGCSEGALPNCACDPMKEGRSSDAKGEFNWSGCSDNIKFGVKFSRLFIDAKESDSRDARGLMNLHNNGAGRKAVSKHVELKCKCHGVSGSCSMRTCWQAMQKFEKIGDFFKKKYKRALLVSMDQHTTGLLAAKKKKHVRKTDIVYMDRSPDYCVYNPTVGSVGTTSRECNTDTTGADKCDDVCCGRGHNTVNITETINCSCKFQWCCFVKCKQCTITRDKHTCKPAKSEYHIYSNQVKMRRNINIGSY